MKIGLFLFFLFFFFGFCFAFYADFGCLPYPLHFQIRCYVPEIYKTCFSIPRTCLKTHLYIKYTFQYKYNVPPTVCSWSDLVVFVSLPTEDSSVSLSETQIICKGWSVEDWSIELRCLLPDKPKVKTMGFFICVVSQKTTVKHTDLYWNNIYVHLCKPVVLL